MIEVPPPPPAGVPSAGLPVAPVISRGPGLPAAAGIGVPGFEPALPSSMAVAVAVAVAVV